MAKPEFTYVGDARLRALLEAYACPVPFYDVRARFMGNIVTPVLGASPLRIIEGLWPCGLPRFESTNESSRLLQALMGLWNHLACHQNPTKPFRFAKPGKLASRKQMIAFMVMRCEEIENFLLGLFNGEEDPDVSEEIAGELDALGEAFALLCKVRAQLTTKAGPGAQKALSDLFRNIWDLDRIAEARVNEVIQVCVAWRRAALSSQIVMRHTLH